MSGTDTTAIVIPAVVTCATDGFTIVVSFAESITNQALAEFMKLIQDEYPGCLVVRPHDAPRPHHIAHVTGLDDVDAEILAEWITQRFRRGP